MHRGRERGKWLKTCMLDFHRHDEKRRSIFSDIATRCLRKTALHYSLISQSPPACVLPLWRNGFPCRTLRVEGAFLTTAHVPVHMRWECREMVFTAEPEAVKPVGRDARECAGEHVVDRRCPGPSPSEG